MYATDNIKLLAKRHGLSRAAIREIADDLDIAVGYVAARRTYIIAEPAAVVAAFNEHLTEMEAAR